MKIQALHLTNFLDYARVRGILDTELLPLIKDLPEDLNAPEASIESDDLYRVIGYIDKKLQDPLLGIRLGSFLNLKSLGLIYQISLQTTKIEEALFYLNQYLNSSFPLAKISFSVGEESAEIKLWIENDGGHLNTIILENIITIIARELATMAGEGTIISLSSPEVKEGYPDYWKQAKEFQIHFTPVVLKANMHDRSKWNLDVLVPEYLKLIETLKRESSFSNLVRIAILSMATPELPDLDSVASSFNMTPRTLQRRLGDEDNSFRKIREDLHQEISGLLIRHNRFSITDISDVLGYSEPAAFIRSFKKWYGKSPEKLRAGSDF